MPHHPKPFYKRKRNAWYVEIDRQQINLGQHPGGLPPPKKRNGRWQPPHEILDQYHALMSRQPEPAPPPAPGDSLVGLIDRFLGWCKEHRAEETYEWYRWRLQLFVDSIDRSLTVAQLKPYHLDEFLARHPEWTSGMKHGACRAVQRAMRWAQKKGYIAQSPVADYEKPRPGKRKVVVAPAEFALLLSLAGGQNFRDLLIVTWETACRPQESLLVEARHVDLKNSRWVFPADEAKGEQWPRIVYLTDTALEITRRLMLKHPEGPIFRNARGVPWTPYAVNCAFIRAQVRLGLLRMKQLGIEVEPLAEPDRDARAKFSPQESQRYRQERKARLKERQRLIGKLARQHGTKYCLYHLRHSWLDRALKRGVDPLTCAILMGHRDPSTISKVYQHLAQSPDYLRDAARKAVS
jgi:integrase